MRLLIQQVSSQARQLSELQGEVQVLKTSLELCRCAGGASNFGAGSADLPRGRGVAASDGSSVETNGAAALPYSRLRRPGDLLGEPSDAATDRLLPEETAATLNAASWEVMELSSAKAASRRSLAEHLESMERLVRESAERQAAEVACTSSRLDVLQGRVARLEAGSAATGFSDRLANSSTAATEQELSDLRSALSRLEDERVRQARTLEEVRTALDLLAAEAHARQATTEEKLDDVNEALGKEMVSTTSRLEQLAARVATCEWRCAAVTELERVQAGLLSAQSERGVHHGSIAECMRLVDKALAESAERQATELDALRALQSRQEVALVGFSDRLERKLAAAQAEVEALRGQLLGLEEAHGPFLQEAQQTRAAWSLERAAFDRHHAELGDRLSQLERLVGVGDVAERHNRELVAVMSQEVESLSGALDSAMHSQQQCSLVTRVTRLERQLVETVERVSCELASADTRLQALNRRALQWERQEGDKQVAAVVDSVVDRVDYIEKALSEITDKHSRELDVVRTAQSSLEAAHARRTREIDGLERVEAHHSTAVQRLTRLEAAVNEAVERHAKDLAGARAKMEVLHERMQAFERHGSAVDDLQEAEARLSRDRSALDARVTTVSARMDHLVKMFGESSDRHTEDMKAALCRSEDMQMRYLNDLDALWKAITASSERHREEVALLRASFETAQGSTKVLQVAQLGERVGKCERALSELQRGLARHAADGELGAAHVAAVVAERLVSLDEALSPAQRSAVARVREARRGHRQSAEETDEADTGSAAVSALSSPKLLLDNIRGESRTPSPSPPPRRPGELALVQQMVAEEREERERVELSLRQLLDEERDERREQVEQLRSMTRVACRVVEESVNERVDQLLRREAEDRAAEATRLWEALSFALPRSAVPSSSAASASAARGAEEALRQKPQPMLALTSSRSGSPGSPPRLLGPSAAAPSARPSPARSGSTGSTKPSPPGSGLGRLLP